MPAQIRGYCWLVGWRHCTARFWTALYCTVLNYSTLHCTELNWTVLHRTAFHCNALHCIVLYCPAMQYTALLCYKFDCTALLFTAMQCNALHCPVINLTALHCFKLNSIFFGTVRHLLRLRQASFLGSHHKIEANFRYTFFFFFNLFGKTDWVIVNDASKYSF